MADTLPLSILTRDDVLARLAAGESFIYFGHTFTVPADVPDDATLAAWASAIGVATTATATSQAVSAGPSLSDLQSQLSALTEDYMAFKASTTSTVATTAQYLTAAGMASPPAGTANLEVEYVPTASITDAVVARQAGLTSVVVSNGAAPTTGFTVTLTGSFQNGTITSYVLNPGDSVTATPDPHAPAGWVLA